MKAKPREFWISQKSLEFGRVAAINAWLEKPKTYDEGETFFLVREVLPECRKTILEMAWEDRDKWKALAKELAKTMSKICELKKQSGYPIGSAGWLAYEALQKYERIKEKI